MFVESVSGTAEGFGTGAESPPGDLLSATDGEPGGRHTPSSGCGGTSPSPLVGPPGGGYGSASAWGFAFGIGLDRFACIGPGLKRPTAGFSSAGLLAAGSWLAAGG